jgi:hypothetical protein
MTNLSPAAQAVLDALHTNKNNSTGPELFWARANAAAALRAVADQVCPSDAMEPRNYLPMAIENNRIRCEILAIADELFDWLVFASGKRQIEGQ